MSEIIKDFIKFIAEVILVLLILSTIFSEDGIVSNTANFLTYAEPTLIQDYVTVASSAATYAPGEFSSTIETSGNPFDIRFYDEESIQIVSVNVNESVQINTKYSQLTPSEIPTTCFIENQTIHITKGIISRISIENNITDICEVVVIV